MPIERSFSFEPMKCRAFSWSFQLPFMNLSSYQLEGHHVKIGSQISVSLFKFLLYKVQRSNDVISSGKFCATLKITSFDWMTWAKTSGLKLSTNWMFMKRRPSPDWLAVRSALSSIRRERRSEDFWFQPDSKIWQNYFYKFRKHKWKFYFMHIIIGII